METVRPLTSRTDTQRQLNRAQRRVSTELRKAERRGVTVRRRTQRELTRQRNQATRLVTRNRRRAESQFDSTVGDVQTATEDALKRVETQARNLV